jgi:hypothetical protein
MADYFSPTVIPQMIPAADLTALDYLLLSNLFDAERNGESWYFFAPERPADVITLDRAALEAALTASGTPAGTIQTHVAEQLARAPAGAQRVELDLSVTSWECILQDVVRRSSTLRYVTAITSFTCSKMCPDGFGGMAVLITADAIRGKSTFDILGELLRRAKIPWDER